MATAFDAYPIRLLVARLKKRCVLAFEQVTLRGLRNLTNVGLRAVLRCRQAISGYFTLDGNDDDVIVVPNLVGHLLTLRTRSVEAFGR
jgi:hypothetical protein